RIYHGFPSGSDQISRDFRPLLTKIAKELQDDTSRIVVIGHTDSRKIKFSARFPSNWHLSVARADHVAGIMRADASLGERVRAEGRADWEPVAPNDTRENRALNRRIDIHIR
ncbi:MAG: OmpA family protein, partial [Desulfobacterales bacterium]